MRITGYIGGGMVAYDLAPAVAPLRAGGAVAQLRVAHAQRAAPNARRPRSERVRLQA